MSTIGAVDIGNNMYLAGLEDAQLTSSTQVRTLKGLSHTMINPLFGGRPLSIGSINSGGAIMGLWCMSTIEAVKALEQTGLEQELDYGGDIYNVLITGNSGFTPLIASEPEGPSKSFTGQFFLTEV